MAFRIERLIAYGTLITVIGLSFRSTLRLAKRNIAVLALPLLAILSTLWSQDRIKSASLGILAFGLTYFAVYLSQRFKGDKLIDLLNIVGIATTLSTYLLVAFVPSVAIRNVDATRAWQGLFVHKNYLGMVMIFFFATAYYTEKRLGITRLFFNAYMASIVVLIVMSQSRTAWLEFALMALYFVFESQFIRVAKMEKVAALAAVAVVSLAMIAIAVNFGGDIAVAMGKTSDMTGRSGIFDVIYPELWKRPLLGFGYQAFWLGLTGESANIVMTPGHTTVSNAENGILQMWLELGAAGTIILLSLLVKSLLNGLTCLKYKPSRFARWNCAIVFLSLLGVVNGDKFMFPDTIEWLLFIVAYVNLAEQVRSTKLAVVEEGHLAWAS